MNDPKKTHMRDTHYDPLEVLLNNTCTHSRFHTRAAMPIAAFERTRLLDVRWDTASQQVIKAMSLYTANPRRCTALVHQHINRTKSTQGITFAAPGVPLQPGDGFLVSEVGPGQPSFLLVRVRVIDVCCLSMWLSVCLSVGMCMCSVRLYASFNHSYGLVNMRINESLREHGRGECEATAAASVLTAFAYAHVSYVSPHRLFMRKHYFKKNTDSLPLRFLAAHCRDALRSGGV